MLYLGIDQHARQITISLRDDNGDVIQARQVSTQPEKVNAFFTDLTRERLREGEEFVAVVEVCGFNDWLIEMLRSYRCRKVILIQPEGRATRKTDRRDAAALSELLWVNRGRLLQGKPVRGLRQVDITSKTDREDRRLTTLRKQAGQSRARIVNAIKQMLRRHNLQWDMPTKIFPTQKAIAWLKKLALPKIDRIEMDYLLADLERIDQRIDELQTVIVERCNARQEANLYVGSTATHSVLRYQGPNGTTPGAFVDAFVTTGAGGLGNPRGLTFDGNGDFYVSSRLTHEVLRYNSDGSYKDTVIQAGEAGVDQPASLAFGPDGKLYVASIVSNSVVRYDDATGAVDTFISGGSAGLESPHELTFGDDGNLYVGSGGASDAVLRYEGPSGSSPGAFMDDFVTSGTGGVDGPRGMVFHPDGSLLVASLGTDEILQYRAKSEAIFVVSLSATSDDPITVDFNTADGTAVAGSDYTTTSGTLTFAPGETSKKIIVPTVDDSAGESSETFAINLTNESSGATIADGQAQATIFDDDNALYVSDIRFESKRGGKDRRAVVEIRSDSNFNEQADSNDEVRADVTVKVMFGNNLYEGTTDSDGVFRTGWVNNIGSGDHYANVDHLFLTGYFWDPLDLDAEDDSDGDGKPDALLAL